MPQFLVLAAVGAGLYAGYRLVRRIGEDAADTIRRAEDELRQRSEVRVAVKARDLGKLAYDPATGEYRPMRRD